VRTPDLILADFHLGNGVDGIDVLGELLRRCDSPPPAALITADGSPELKQRARLNGLAVLHKPVRPGALRALLSALSRRAPERDVAKPQSNAIPPGSQTGDRRP
ncbi:MAG: response regulator, partial [Tahibacter sp.]